MTSRLEPAAALALALRVADVLLDDAVASATSDGGPFAALVLDGATGEVVRTSTNRVTATTDPTAHAEVSAIRAAAAARGTVALTGLVLVSSCEPCPMCLASALWARLDTLVYLATRHDAAAAGFDDEVFHTALGTPSPLPTTLAGMRVLHLPHEHAQAPFAAWAANADRRAY